MAVKKKALSWELITDRETYGKVTEKRLRECFLESNSDSGWKMGKI